MDRRRELLLKYRQKTINPEEWEELLTDLRTSDFSQYELLMDEVWQGLPGDESFPSSKDAAQRGSAQRDAAQRNAAQRVYARLEEELSWEKSPRMAKIRAFPWGKVAAGLLLLLAPVVFFLSQDQPVQHIATAANETRTLLLPDSSVVTLNERSELSYAEPWDEQAPREVWVTGEAYFSVKHTSTHQTFVVHTEPVAIEVLGTEFNVHNRGRQPEVTLASGSVLLSTPQTDQVQQITMKPGEQVTLTEAQTFEKNAVNPAIYTAWKQQELVLDNTPLREVARLLERQHEIQVSIPDSTLRTTTLTGTYPGQDLDAVLDMLADLLAAEALIERQETRVIIRTKDQQQLPH